MSVCSKAKRKQAWWPISKVHIKHKEKVRLSDGIDHPVILRNRCQIVHVRPDDNRQ